MGRLSFSGARTGRRASGTGFAGIQRMEYEIGEQKRLIFPVLPDAEGNPGLVVLGEPFHSVKPGFVTLVSNRGNTYTPYTIRCMHPYSQTDPKVAINSAQRGEMCPFCELAQYEMRHTYAVMEERYGEDGFKDLSKEEQKAFYKEMDEHHQVSQSYYQKTDADGNKYNVNNLEIALLALELELEDAESKNGRKVKRPVIGEDGLPKYKKILVPMSQNRLDKFKIAADNAFEQGTLDYEQNAYPFIENEGTEHEEEVLVGFVDFAVKFPQKSTKMESGKDMNVLAVPASNSVVTEEFIQAIQSEGAKLQEEAMTSFKNLNAKLKAFTPAEGLAFMSDEGAYYFEMKEEYGRPDDEEFNQKVFDTILGGSNATQENDAVEVEAEEDVAEEQVAATATARTASTKQGAVKPSTTTTTKAAPTGNKQKLSPKKNEEVPVNTADEVEDIDEMLQDFDI